MEKIGEVDEDTLEEIQETLGSGENIQIITQMKSKKGKELHSLILTNRRIIIWKKGRKRLMKETERYQDFLYSIIGSVKIEPKKKYDVLQIRTERETEEVMIPKGKGKLITGQLREQQANQ